MEKKFKFSDKAMVSKVVYLTVIAILCVSAIVIGIVAANNRKKVDNNTPGVTDTDKGNTGNNNTDGGANKPGEDNKDDGNKNPTEPPK